MLKFRNHNFTPFPTPTFLNKKVKKKKIYKNFKKNLKFFKNPDSPSNLRSERPQMTPDR